MELLLSQINFVELFTNLRSFVESAIVALGPWVYLLLFVIVFCETGLVVFPILPGDSLLFITGSFTVAASANAPSLDLPLLLVTFYLAPILGDTTNYWIGRQIGPKIFHKEKVRFLNKAYLDRAHAFYEKHGGKAVAIGRFVPIIRTFVPFVAGIGKMSYPRFLVFSITGTLAWITTCVMAGHFFGQLEFVQKHFETLIIAIIVISLLPACIAYLRARMAVGSEKKT